MRRIHGELQAGDARYLLNELFVNDYIRSGAGPLLRDRETSFPTPASLARVRG